MNCLASQLVNQSAGLSLSQSVVISVSDRAREYASECVSKSVRVSVSQSVSQSVRLSASSPISQPVTVSVSSPVSVSANKWVIQ